MTPKEIKKKEILSTFSFFNIFITRKYNKVFIEFSAILFDNKIMKLLIQYFVQNKNYTNSYMKLILILLNIANIKIANVKTLDDKVHTLFI